MLVQACGQETTRVTGEDGSLHLDIACDSVYLRVQSELYGNLDTVFGQMGGGQ